MHFEWVRFNIEISNVTGPNFTGIVLPNAGAIAVDGIKIRFWLSSSVSEIFAAELRSRPKSSQISHVFGPEIFWGVPPKILDQHYKIEPNTDHRTKFHAGRPTHLGDFASGEKKHQRYNVSPLRRLSLLGVLKRNWYVYNDIKFCHVSSHDTLSYCATQFCCLLLFCLGSRSQNVAEMLLAFLSAHFTKVCRVIMDKKLTPIYGWQYRLIKKCCLWHVW